jgi:hypothetical protein
LTDVKCIALSLADKVNEHDSKSQQQARGIMQAMFDNTAQLLKLQLKLSAVPQTPIDSSIHLLDALDRPHKLPYEFFQSFEMIHAHLLTKFRNNPGGPQVGAGLYQLVLEGRSPRIVDADNWSAAVFPGSRVTMFIVLSSLRIPPNRCPRPSCNRLVSLEDSRKSRLRCSECHLAYHPTSVQRLLDLDNGRATIEKLQKQHDIEQYGRRFSPADLSVIASISNPTVSNFSIASKASTALSAPGDGATGEESSLAHGKLRHDEPLASELTLARLTQQNLEKWESIDDQEVCDFGRDDAMSMTGKSLTLSVIDWRSSPSGMMAWLNSSALPSSGSYFPEIEDVEMLQDAPVDNEAHALEVLRRVCMPWSTPAACHYLDASEYQGMTGPTVIHLRRILDLFPKLSPVLARRLAQNNHTQTQELARLRASAARTAEVRQRSGVRQELESPERLLAAEPHTAGGWNDSPYVNMLLEIEQHKEATSSSGIASTKGPPSPSRHESLFPHIATSSPVIPVDYGCDHTVSTARPPVLEPIISYNSQNDPPLGLRRILAPSAKESSRDMGSYGGRSLYDYPSIHIPRKRAHSSISSGDSSCNSSMQGNDYFDTGYQRTKARRGSARSGASYHIHRGGSPVQYTSTKASTDIQDRKPQIATRRIARCELCDRDLEANRKRSFQYVPCPCL